MLDIYPSYFKDGFRPQIWKDIPDYVVPGIIPYRYMISTYGIMYDKETQIAYPNEKFNAEKRYVYKRFKLLDGSVKLLGLHVVTLKTFKPIPGCENLQVNHIDGVKYHNWLWNLEWLNCGGNIKHAYDTGLHAIGEDNATSKFTNQQIHQICSLLSKGLKTIDIINILQPSMPNLNIKIAVDAIKSGKYWNHISKNYDLSNVYRNHFILSDQDVENICRYFEKYGTNIMYKDLLDLINFDWRSLNQKELDRVKGEVSLLRNKRTKKGICEKYNY